MRQIFLRFSPFFLPILTLFFVSPYKTPLALRMTSALEWNIVPFYGINVYKFKFKGFEGNYYISATNYETL